MTEVYKALSPQDAHIVKVLLIDNGIDAFVLNDMLFNLAGKLPFDEDILPVVFIAGDSQKEKALKIVSEYVKNLNRECSGKEWICKKCQESNPDTFEICWNCQEER